MRLRNCNPLSVMTTFGTPDLATMRSRIAFLSKSAVTLRSGTSSFHFENYQDQQHLVAVLRPWLGSVQLSFGFLRVPPIVRRGFPAILFPEATYGCTSSMLRRLRCPLCVIYFYTESRFPSHSTGISGGVLFFCSFGSSRRLLFRPFWCPGSVSGECSAEVRIY